MPRPLSSVHLQGVPDLLKVETLSLGVCSEGMCVGVGIVSHIPFTSPLHPAPDTTGQNGTDCTQ